MPFVGVLWVYRAVANELRAICALWRGVQGLQGNRGKRAFATLSAAVGAVVANSAKRGAIPVASWRRRCASSPASVPSRLERSRLRREPGVLIHFL